MEKKTQTEHLWSGLAAMAILGGLAFWGLHSLATSRFDQPLGPEPAVLAPTPLAAVREGTRTDLELAAQAIRDGRRAEATTAIDAARRAARVGHDVDPDAFGPALAAANRARRAIQNGRFEDAGAIAAAGAARLAARAADRIARATATIPARQDAYRGALVVNAEGVRIGEIESFDGARAVVVDGVRRDWFGFIDRSGRRVKVPTERLLFGRPRRAGDTTVVLATTCSRFADVAQEQAGHAAE